MCVKERFSRGNIINGTLFFTHDNSCCSQWSWRIKQSRTQALPGGSGAPAFIIWSTLPVRSWLKCLALQRVFQISANVHQEPGTSVMLTEMVCVPRNKQPSCFRELAHSSYTAPLDYLLDSQLWLCHCANPLPTSHYLVQHGLRALISSCLSAMTVTVSPSEPRAPNKPGHLTLLKPTSNFSTFLFAWNVFACICWDLIREKYL